MPRASRLLTDSLTGAACRRPARTAWLASENNYDYAGQDAINSYDLSGTVHGDRGGDSGWRSICFDIKPSHREEVQKRLIDRYESKLAEHEIEHDKRRLIEIIGTNCLDLRSIAQKVDFEFA